VNWRNQLYYIFIIKSYKKVQIKYNNDRPNSTQLLKKVSTGTFNKLLNNKIIKNRNT